MADFSSPPDRTGFEPELGGILRNLSDRTGFEPELGGILRNLSDRTGFEPELGGLDRQKGVYVDEITCIGCKHCAHVAPNTFFIEANYGRSRVFNQDGDTEAIVQEAIDTCPVDCIYWADYTTLRQLEENRTEQEIKPLGFPQVHRDPKNLKKTLPS